MLRIFQNKSPAGAKSYYSTADYYSEGQELVGLWRGEGAKRLGLSGDVDKASWDALCDNLHPASGQPLTLRQKGDRTCGYDVNFHVPKSVSVLYGLTGDERILEAFRESVHQTMLDMEAEMQTRVRKDGRNEDRTTGNMAWGEFVHFTARPVDGVPDPHLHAHCFVFNSTFDEHEQAWKAGQFRDLKRDAPYFQAVFHTRLADRLADFGYGIRRTAKGWEINGVSDAVVAKFSRRTELIEQEAREKGIVDDAEKDKLGAKTREGKAKLLTAAELLADWQSRLDDNESSALTEIRERARPIERMHNRELAAGAVKHAIDHCFVRKSVVPERTLLAEALRFAVGEATPEEIGEQLSASGVIVGELKGRRMATVPEVLREEERMIAFAKEGRGTCLALGDPKREFTRAWLNDEQKNAVRHILSSKDRVVVMRGAAGVGKTSLMQEAVEGIRAGGHEAFAFAPSADASRGVLRAEGFADAETVARLLKDEKLQEQIRGQVIWIDEAGLLGSKSMREVFDLAGKLNARVILSGDRKQHASVERGSPLRQLEQEAGIVPAEVREIQRQKGQYKEAIKLLSEGKVREGFDRLDELGWVREIAEEDRYLRLAADYVGAVESGKTAIVVSPTHREKDLVIQEIRTTLRAMETLGNEEREFTTLCNARLTEAERADPVRFSPGQVIQYVQNAKGHRKGERIAVTGKETLPLDQANQFQVFNTRVLRLAAGDVIRITHNGKTMDDKHALNNGALYRVRGFDGEGNIVLGNGWTIDRNFGHLDYGYVVTSHTAQGKTVDRVFIGQSNLSSPAASREQFYVSASRGRESVTVYTDDRKALREAIDYSDDRVTATELLARIKQHHVAKVRDDRDRLLELAAATSLGRLPEMSQEMVYER